MVILASGGIGIAWRRLRRRGLEDFSLREGYLLGIVVHVVMLALMLTLPWAVAVDVLGAIGVPVIVIYPVATALLAALMVSRLRRERVVDTLHENEERLRLTLDATEQGLLRPQRADRRGHRQRPVRAHAGLRPRRLPRDERRLDRATPSRRPRGGGGNLSRLRRRGAPGVPRGVPSANALGRLEMDPLRRPAGRAGRGGPTPSDGRHPSRHLGAPRSRGCPAREREPLSRPACSTLPWRSW